MTKRANVAHRRNDVKEMLLGGKSSQHIYDVIMHRHGVTKSVVMKDITVVYGEVREYVNRQVEEVMATHIGRYERIYEMCMDVGNAKDAMKALESIEKLLRMHVNTPLVQFNQLNLEGVTDDTLRELVNNLKNDNQG